jgi:protein ImuA
MGGLEEIAALTPADHGAAIGFAAARLTYRQGELGQGDRRPVVFAATSFGLRERGAPFFAGLSRFGLEAGRSLVVLTDKEVNVLWALEEALKSGAVAGGLALAGTLPFVMTRRLTLSADKGRAVGILLRPRPPADLSAARMRWRVGYLPSAAHRFDPKAPGAPRWRAELTRRRAGPPGLWDVEWDDETHRLRLVSGLADHALAARPRPAAAA